MEKLRLGVIGTGSVVREIYQHLYFHSEYSRLLSIEAACDPNEKALNEFCEQYKIPAERRFSSYDQMIQKVKLDAVQVNTPDSLHEKPTIYALEHGLDAMIPKPLSDSSASAWRMIQAARKAGRVLGVDFHKREDPRIKEGTARIANKQYGQFQAAVFYMLDKLMVADPNHQPRFFASPDFAAKNSPISFLTVHMADALITMVRQLPVSVRARAWSQKLPSLKPIPVNGYDMADVELVFDNGATAHVITGWHLPNTAHSTTVQSARLIFTDGVLDLGIDTPGYHELTADGIVERNPLFRNFEPDGSVSGYGIGRPGRLYQRILNHRNGTMTSQQYAAAMDLTELGFWTTAVLEAAEKSLHAGQRDANGVVAGREIDLQQMLREQLGESAPKI